MSREIIRQSPEVTLRAVSQTGNRAIGDPIRLGWNESTLAFIGFAVVVLGLLLGASRGNLVEKTDFSLIYTGARIVYVGRGAELYDLEQQKQMNASLFLHPQPLLYEHPPFEALMLAPLASLPYRTAYLIWGLLNACIWLALPLVLRAYAPAPREPLGYFALWLVFAPLGVALFQGQTSLLLLLVFVLTFIELKKGDGFRAGMWLGLGLFKFQFVVPLVLIFIVRKQWKLVRGFACSAAILALVSLLAVGGNGIVSYFHLLLKVSSGPENVSYGSGVDMPTLLGFVYAILGRWLGGWTTVTSAILSLPLILFTARNWGWTRKSEAAFDLAFASALAVSLITGFHMFTHDFSPLVLALFLAMAHFPREGQKALRLVWGTTLVLFWIPPIYFALVSWHCMYLMFPLLLIFTIATLFMVRILTEHLQLEGHQLAAQYNS